MTTLEYESRAVGTPVTLRASKVRCQLLCVISGDIGSLSRTDEVSNRTQPLSQHALLKQSHGVQNGQAVSWVENGFCADKNIYSLKQAFRRWGIRSMVFN